MENYREPKKVIINPSLEEVADLDESSVVGFDIETTGLEPHKGEIRLYQVYIPKKDIVYIWDRKSDSFWDSFSKVLELLKSDLTEKRIHNSLFEYSWIREKHNIRIENVLDTQILSQIDKAGLYMSLKKLLGETSPNSLAGLSIYYGMGLDKTHQMFDYGQEDIPEEVYQYAANDAKATWWLGEKIERPKQDIDLQMTQVFGELNYSGFPANLERLKDAEKIYRDEYIRRKKEIEESIHVNPASPKQVLEWIKATYPDSKPPVDWDRKEKRYKQSSNKAALNLFLADNPEIDSKWISLIQAYRVIKKASDYPKEYLENYRNGRIHGNYSVLAFQGEGRSSCKGSNLQNVPKLSGYVKEANLPCLRSIFEANKGYKFIEIDLSGAHAQIARWLSKDTNLIKARDTGLKLHYFTLEKMFSQKGISISPEEIKRAHKDPQHPMHNEVKNIYKLSKNVFYSFVNFAGSKTLQSTFLNQDEIVLIQTCKEYLDVTAKTFSGLRKFQEKILELVNNRYKHERCPLGYIGKVSYLNIPEGSRIYFVEGMSKASKMVSAIWIRIEATAIKQALLEMYNLIKTHTAWCGVEIVNFSHDSFVLHVPEDSVSVVGNQAQEILISKMTQYVGDYDHEMDFDLDGKKVGFEVKTCW